MSKANGPRFNTLIRFQVEPSRVVTKLKLILLIILSLAAALSNIIVNALVSKLHSLIQSSCLIVYVQQVEGNNENFGSS